jgi:hypothetical protein
MFFARHQSQVAPLVLDFAANYRLFDRFETPAYAAALLHATEHEARPKQYRDDGDYRQRD